MFMKSRPNAQQNLTAETSDIARDASRGSGTFNWLTGLVSALALIFSGISLYETVLKQAEVYVFVPNTIAYTRDPSGSFEVFVVPVTVANTGARDGLVSSFDLTVKNSVTGVTRTFHSNFIAGDNYLSTKEDYTKGQTRPKRPFVPIAIPGRASRSDTLLFYPDSFNKQRVLTKEGSFEFKLVAKSQGIEKLSFFGTLGGETISPLQFTATLPKVAPYFDGQINTGYSARMFVKK